MTEVFCWGRGEDGQLGLGEKSDKWSPSVISSLTEEIGNDEITQVVCGSGHSGLLTANGRLYTWGRGDDGRLGHSANSWKLMPTLVSAFASQIVTYVNCGSYHTAAVTSTGMLFTWGGGMYGKLGHGNEVGFNFPKHVETLRDVRQVACGSRHTACLVGQNKIYSWGEKRSGVTGLGPTHRTGLQLLPELVPDEYFSLSLSVSQSGGANQGQASSSSPQVVVSAARTNSAVIGFSVKKLVACGFHTGLITDSGELFTWGEGRFGRLGRGNDDDDFYPKIVPRDHFNSEDVVDVSCGGFHTAAITKSGKLYVWGGGEHGQLGMGSRENCYSPTPIDSTLFIEGCNQSAELREYTIGQTDICMKAKQVVCGWSHTVCYVVLDPMTRNENGHFISKDLIFSWGNSDHGKLGQGTNTTETKPQLVYSLLGKDVMKLASYNEHTLVLCDPKKNLRSKLGKQSSSLMADLLSLRSDDSFSDVTFVVEGKELSAHKCILSARSAHFKAMFENNYNFKESSQQKVVITGGTFGMGPKLSYKVFSILLDYIYTDKLPTVDQFMSDQEPRDENRMLDEEENYFTVLMGVFMAADMYGLDHLKRICEGRVRNELNVENAVLFLLAARENAAADFQETLMTFIVDNFDMVSKSESFEKLDKDLILEIVRQRR